MQEEQNEEELTEENISNESETQETITRITGMYQEWFLDYASYVILERAVPGIGDGFKPVHSVKGRRHASTCKRFPHFLAPPTLHNPAIRDQTTGTITQTLAPKRSRL